MSSALSQSTGDGGHQAAAAAAASPSAPHAPTDLKASIIAQYGAIIPEYLDLFNDVGASELFVVEGDSLLLHLFAASSQVDWSLGGQHLHLIYLLENFFHLFQERSGKFRIVFFQAHRSLYVSTNAAGKPVLDYSKLAARELVIQHLKLNTKILVDIFDSWLGPENQLVPAEEGKWNWRKCLNLYPAFVVLGDGELLKNSIGDNLLVPRRLVDATDDDSAFILRAFLFNTVGHQTAAVYASSIGTDNNRMMGFVVKAKLHDHLAHYEAEASRIIQSRLQFIESDLPTIGKIPSSLVPSTEDKSTAAGHPLRERLSLVALAALASPAVQDSWDAESSAGGSADGDLAKCLLVHHLLQQHLPLSLRAQVLETDDVTVLAPLVLQRLPKFKNFVEGYHKHIAAILMDRFSEAGGLSSLLANVDGTTTIGLADFFDGRLLALVALQLSSKGQISSAAELDLTDGTGASAEPEALWKVVSVDPFFPLFSGTQPQALPLVPPAAPQGTKLLPVSHKLVSDVLREDLVNIDTYDPNTEAQTINTRRQNGSAWASHCDWNVNVPMLTDAFWQATADSDSSENTTQASTWRAIRSQQFFIRFIHKYAESLTGGAGLHQRQLTVDSKGRLRSEDSDEKDTVPDEAASAATADAKKGGAAKKPPPGGWAKGKASKEKPKAGAAKKSKADEIREKQAAAKSKKVEDDERSRWDNIRRDVEAHIKSKEVAIAERMMDEFTVTCKVKSVVLEAAMYRLNYYYLRWRTAILAATATASTGQIVAGGPKGVPERVIDTAITFNLLHKIVDHYTLEELGDDKRRVLEQTLLDMGFVDSSQLVLQYWGKKSLADPAKALVKPRSSIRFMLEHMGHLLKRKESSGPDKRVGFIPDRWQKDLLDLVDKRGSALLCAPTSSGKTFISYYAMEQVLKDSNDGVAIYVSPTKALVNQVSAEIYARFGSLQSQLGEGMSIYGYFTRDYRYKVHKCRILVTVPECFEMLLLSPQHEEWRRKIKYVILDEVHSIGDLSSGEAWEHVISLIDSPFLALSATVGNPEDLKQWMAAKQKFVELQHKKEQADANAPKRSYEFALIYHHNRHSDLEKYAFLPSVRPDGLHLDSVWAPREETSQFIRIHPLACLTSRRIKDRGLPDDLVLEPKDCLELFDAMWEVAKTDLKDDAYRKRLETLHVQVNPDFTTSRRITRPQTRKWEVKVKEEFVKWTKEGFDLLSDRVLGKLGNKYHQTMADTNKEWSEKVNVRTDTKKYLKENIGDLLASLAQQDKLPAIVFCWDKYLCEELVASVVEWLEKEEQRKSSTSDAVKERRQREKLLKAQEKKNKTARDAQLKKKSALEAVVKSAEESPIGDEAPVDPELSFTTNDVDIIPETKDILSGYPKDLAWVRGLQRGIGVHHSSLPTKYRQSVERLFRVRGLLVVFATQTLSLGVNMPCKTVVFAGDDVHLNALSYRQMSGRAGRRGFDKLGRIVFFGIPAAKINRLLTGDLQTLQGNFPVSTSLVQRCFNMIKKSQNTQGALDATARLFQKPWTQYISQEESKAAFRVAVDYMLTQGLLTPDGNPAGLADYMTYLYYAEPTNYILLSLLYSNVLQDEICTEENIRKKGLDNVAKELMHIFAAFFGPIRTHRSIHFDPLLNSTLAAQQIAERDAAAAAAAIPASTTSKVVLEELPANVLAQLRAHNEKVIKHFVETTTLIISQGGEKYAFEASQLPMSKVSFAKTSCPYTGGLIDLLNTNKISNKIRSPFASLSGKGDKFTDIQDLVQSARAGLGVDLSTLPICHLPSPTANWVLNRFAFDFFEHGNLKLLKKQNGIRGEGPWNSLKVFSTVIIGLIDILKKTNSTNSDSFVRVANRLAADFDTKFQNITWFS